VCVYGTSTDFEDSRGPPVFEDNHTEVPQAKKAARPSLFI
jgi:hypothetical protein